MGGGGGGGVHRNTCSHRYKNHGITLDFVNGCFQEHDFMLCYTYLNWKYINVKANEPLGREDGIRYTKVIYMLKQIWHLGSVLIEKVLSSLLKKYNN